MLLEHAVALAQARSYLAALADQAEPVDVFVEYQQVLLELDELHGGVFPPTSEVAESVPAVLYRIAYDAMEGLAAYDVDRLRLELCISRLIAARGADLRS